MTVDQRLAMGKTCDDLTKYMQDVSPTPNGNEWIVVGKTTLRAHLETAYHHGYVAGCEQTKHQKDPQP